MQRGERTMLMTVLTIVVLVGILALVALFRNPTGMVMQNQGVYVTESQGNLAVSCKNPYQQMNFLRYESNYAVYCCLEDMIGQNECRFPHRVLLVRTY